MTTSPGAPRSGRCVVVVAASGGHGGPVASLLDVLPHVRGRRVVVGPWTPEVAGRLGSVADSMVTTPRPLGRARVAYVRRVASVLRTEQPDVIMANGLTEVAMVSVAVRLARCHAPIRVWVHNYEVPRVAGVLRGSVRRLEPRIGWYAVSDLAARVTRSAGWAPEVTIVPNPIAADVEAIGRADEDPPRVGFLGTDRPYKGFDLLPAIIEATTAPVGWRLFTGRGIEQPTWGDIDRLTARADVDVRVPGRLEPVVDAYRQCDIVLVPSRQESFCRVAAEAMRNRLPVVASDLEPLRALVGDDAGFLFPVDDVGAAAAAVDSVAGDAELRRRMGAAGHARSLEFDQDRIGARWAEILDDA